MVRVEWSALSGDEVEAVLSNLLYNWNGRALRIRPSQGDFGIDAIVPAAADSDKWDVYQIKKFAANLDASQKAQIEKSFQRVLVALVRRKVPLNDWYLVTPLDPTLNNLLDWFNDISAIPHELLMQAVQERVCDQTVLTLLRAILRAGVLEDGQVRRLATGAAQGGVISPMLCNVYLHRLDRQWSTREHGILVRYADDLIAVCKSRQQAGAALERITVLLAELGLQPKAAKTRIVHLEVGGGGLDFLGFHHRLVRSTGKTGRRQVTFLVRWPADRAMQHARDRIRELTDRSRLLLPVTVMVMVEGLNRFLRGWAAYFRYGLLLSVSARSEAMR